MKGNEPGQVPLAHEASPCPLPLSLWCPAQLVPQMLLLLEMVGHTRTRNQWLSGRAGPPGCGAGGTSRRGQLSSPLPGNTAGVGEQAVRSPGEGMGGPGAPGVQTGLWSLKHTLAPM